MSSRFLTLNNTPLASYETSRSQDALILRINLNQRTGDRQTSSLRLALETTTLQVDVDIILLCYVQLSQRLLNYELQD